MEKGHRLSPWIWVPTLYFAEGVPNAVVAEASSIMYADLDVEVAKITLITGSMYLAWVVKPLWSPIVDLLKTKRWWVILTELILAAGFLGLSVSLQSPSWLLGTQVCLWILALTSATQDIAADGFFMLALEESDQAAFTGVRSTAYKLSALFTKGGLVWLAGFLALSVGKFSGWGRMFLVPAAVYLALAIYHFFVMPRPDADSVRPLPSLGEFVGGYANSFGSFFRKEGVGRVIVFVLLFRLAEVQVLAVLPSFLKKPIAEGGLALTTQQVGLAYGGYGIAGIMLGGILAGMLVAKQGVKKWYWPMIFIMHVPNAAFLYLSFTQNHDMVAVSICLFLEQFGYGFGFTVLTLYLMYFCRGPLRTSHYAIATGFMAAAFLIKMVAGAVQEKLGFTGFFEYVAVCTLPSFVVAWMAWKDLGFLEYFEPKKADPDDVGISPE